MQSNQNRIKTFLEDLSLFTATPGTGTTRLTYSPEDQLARTYLKEQMKQVGLKVREDAVGNIYGRLEGKDASLPAVIVGSHFDSVPNGGAFDGPAGVVTGLEVAALFQENQLQPVYPLEIIAMVEEEGSRFGSGLLGSRMLAGQVSAESLISMKDASGVSVNEAMLALGFNGNQLPEARRTGKDVKAFIELHIEQGPVLEDAGEDVGIVETIVGMTELKVTITGRAGHAGTTPMDARRDALAAAVQILADLPQLAIEAEEATVLTVGKLTVYPNGANVIPNIVVFTVDIRSKSEACVQAVDQQVRTIIQTRTPMGITAEIEEMLYQQPVQLSGKIHQQLTANSEALGLKSRSMVSGAGHDAMVFAGFTEVGLVFVPSKDGLSHTPEEWTDYEQIQKGIEVVYETVKQLTKAEI
ncbi:Zn-dependent hydrolase [Carnobacterium antarcticum]|uniref:Zn-dependent hydrolase n=1 Tax=Carnobacterium antarcticum TaxID=2126436 RepID=A0ABW4NL13_9LACT|nr:Zn-dependent hydrolase [Carnobacterium sp. CP1]ALV21805.1 N-carbamoyl-L-amino acid hydrolase [Carnobacterium sp. CP1]